VVLPRRVGHAAFVLEVNHVRFDLVGSYICIGCVDRVLAAESSGKPALEELQLLAVVVYGPSAPAARTLGREEEVNRVPEVEFPETPGDGEAGSICVRNSDTGPILPPSSFNSLLA
jgi:hypothetical protein